MLIQDSNRKGDTYYIAYTRLAVNEYRIEKIGCCYEDIEVALKLGTSVYIGGLRKFIEVYNPKNLNQFF